MVVQIKKMIYTLIVLFVIKLWYVSKAYDFVCPTQSQWRIRAKSMCTNQRDYSCLFDVNLQINVYREKCIKPRIVGPGYKYVFQPNPNRDSCSLSLYQPFIFNTTGYSSCAYHKSVCNSEGQTTYKDGTTRSDRTCSCNKKMGYNFVKHPDNECYCYPPSIDCSCYLGITLNNITTSWKDLACYSEIDIIPSRSRGLNKSQVLMINDYDNLKCNIDSATKEYRTKAAIYIMILVLSYIPVALAIHILQRIVQWYQVHFDLSEPETSCITESETVYTTKTGTVGSCKIETIDNIDPDTINSSDTTDSTIPEIVNSTIPEIVDSTIPEIVDSTIPEIVDSNEPETVDSTVPELENNCSLEPEPGNNCSLEPEPGNNASTEPEHPDKPDRFKEEEEECHISCKGLGKDDLKRTPTDRHLVRLVQQLSVTECNRLVTELGLKNHEIADIEYNYTNHPLNIKIMAMQHWKKTYRKGKPVKLLSDLQNALSAIGCNRHLLCKVLKEDKDVTDINDDRMQKIPSDEILNNLSKKLNDCALHLGTELGLTSFQIVESIDNYKKEKTQQTREILRRWKNSEERPSVYKLMRSLKHVDHGGFSYLESVYPM